MPRLQAQCAFDSLGDNDNYTADYFDCGSAIKRFNDPEKNYVMKITLFDALNITTKSKYARKIWTS